MADTHQRPRFLQQINTPFSAEIREAARQYLDSHGDHRYGNILTAFKALMLFLCMAALFFMAMHTTRAITYIPLYVLATMAAMVLSVNTMHDASHGALCRSRLLNAIAARVAALPLGIEPVYWQMRHVRYHHPYANIEHHDLDTAANHFLRQTPFQAWSPQYRFQHLYWPVIAALSMPYIGLVYDWSDRLGLTPLKSDRLLPGVRGWALFLLSKALHFGLFLVAPLILLGPVVGNGAIVAGYVLAQMAASCLCLMLLLGTHWADTQFFDVSDGQPLPHTRDEHTFLTCCDWTARPLALNVLFGGLNHHLTHHLFPNHGHRHYRALARIVEQAAKRHGLPYRSLTYRELRHAQQRFLKSMGQQPGTHRSEQGS